MKLKKIFLTCLATFFMYSLASSQCQIVGTTNSFAVNMDGCTQSYTVNGTVTLQKWNGTSYVNCGGSVLVEIQWYNGSAWQTINSMTTSSSFYGIGMFAGWSTGQYRIYATNPNGNCTCVTTTPYISATMNVTSSVTAPTFVVGQKYDATNYTTISAGTTCSSPFTNICPVYTAPYSYMMTAVNSTIPWYQVANGQWSCKLEEVPVSNCSATPSLIFNTSYATIGSMSNLDNIDLNALAVAASFPANYINTTKRYKFTLNIKYTCGDVFTYVCWLRYTTAGCRISSEKEEDISETLNNSISVYPNPVNSILEIKADNAIKSVILIDISGKETTAELKNNTIDMSKFSAGMYTIKIYTTDGVSIKKIVKQD